MADRQHHRGGPFGESDYRRAGLERLADSLALLEDGRFAGSIYLAGRAVESMLRALVWKFDRDVRQGRKSLATGHDLRELLTAVRNLGVLRDNERTEEFAARIERVGRLWFNNLRFAHGRLIENHWRRLGIVGSSASFKHATEQFFSDCSIIVRRSEALCQK